MRKKRKRPVGKPTLYRVEYAEQAYKQCLAGATDEDLAHFFGIAESTLNQWKQKHCKFVESLRRGKEVARGEVANALFQAAVGYERMVEKVVDGEVVECKEWVSGDVGAQKYFLNNRAHKHWRNEPEVATVVNNNTLQLPDEFIEAANRARKERMMQRGEG